MLRKLQDFINKKLIWWLLDIRVLIIVDKQLTLGENQQFTITRHQTLIVKNWQVASQKHFDRKILVD